MKSYIQSKRSVLLALLCTSVFLSPRDHAGLIGILKGNQEKPGEDKSFQKVGFVGCANVKEVTGTVEYLHGIDAWLPLKAGAHLQEGDVVRTRQGRVLLQMCESSSLVKVTPNTMARLVPLSAGWDRATLSGVEERSGYVVRSLHGKAYIQNARLEWQPVGVNDILPKGAIVRADQTASIDIFNPVDRKTLRIRSGGLMQLGTEPALAQSPSVVIADRK